MSSMADFRTQSPRLLFRTIVKVYFIFSTLLFLTYVVIDRERTPNAIYKNKDEVHGLDYVVYTSEYRHVILRNEKMPDTDERRFEPENGFVSEEQFQSGENDMADLEDGYLDENSMDEEGENMVEGGQEKSIGNNTKGKVNKKDFYAKWRILVQEQNELYDHVVVKTVKSVQMAYLTAIATNYTHNGSYWDTIIINGWERKKYEKASLYCCFLSGNLSAVTPVKRRPRWNTPKIKLVLAIQFICDNPWKGDSMVLPKSVGVSTSVTCSGVQYVDVEYAMKPSMNDSLAFCGKILYGTYPAERIIEWMEMNKAMGVSHVALFTYNVTKQAMAVLKYYQQTGYLTLKEFDFPLKSVFPRYIGQKYLLAWIDEQVTVFDCIQRFRGYKYVGILDVDEFVVPKNPDIKDYPTMLKRMLRKYPKAAGFTFQSELFILSWGETHKDSSMWVSRYRNRTKPLWDRRKSIFLPDRVNPQSVWTHGFTGIKPYVRVHLLSQMAAVFHYRNCRRQWVTNGTCLINAKRYTDNTMSRYLPRIQTKVLDISKRLLNHSNAGHENMEHLQKV